MYRRELFVEDFVEWICIRVPFLCVSFSCCFLFVREKFSGRRICLRCSFC